jgi:hypothetical protein
MLQNNDIKVTAKTKSESQKDEAMSFGFRIRTGVKSGAWRCSACEGKTMGSNLFQPNCEFCEKI